MWAMTLDGEAVVAPNRPDGRTPVGARWGPEAAARRPRAAVLASPLAGAAQTPDHDRGPRLRHRPPMTTDDLGLGAGTQGELAVRTAG